MNDSVFNSNILGRKAARLVRRGGVPLLVVGIAAALVACGGGESGDDVALTPVATATSSTGSVTPTVGNTTPVSVSTGTSASPTGTTAASATSAPSATSDAPSATAIGTTPSPEATAVPTATVPAATAAPPTPTAVVIPPTATPVPDPPTAVPTPTTKPAPAPVTISVQDPANFVPAVVSVPVGTTVTWVWNGEIPHDVSSASFSSGILNPGSVFSFTFSSPGTYQYNCEVHDFSRPPMRGTITVTQ